MAIISPLINLILFKNGIIILSKSLCNLGKPIEIIFILILISSLRMSRSPQKRKFIMLENTINITIVKTIELINHKF